MLFESVTTKQNSCQGIELLNDSSRPLDFDYRASLLRAERTPGEVAVSQEGQGGQGLNTPVPSAQTNSMPCSQQDVERHSLLSDILPWQRRQLECIRKPGGYRYFPDRQREAYARYIEWSMSAKGTRSLFGTYTFKNYISPSRAEDMLDKHLARMSEALNNAGGSRLRYFVASEWQRRQVIHFHSILIGHGLERLSRKRWELRWQNLSGGFARLYDADTGAAPYLAKYLNKSLGGDLRAGGAWQGLHPAASIDPGPERWALE